MLDKHNPDQKSDKLMKMITSIWASRLIYWESRGIKPNWIMLIAAG